MARAQAEPANDQEPEIDYTRYATKPPTSLQARFPEWIKDQTGYDPGAAKTKAEAFAEGVRLATALRMHFQASPENQRATLEERAARAGGAAASAAQAEEQKPTRAATRRKPAATAESAAPAAETTPRPRGRRRASTAATAAAAGAPAPF